MIRILLWTLSWFYLGGFFDSSDQAIDSLCTNDFDKDIVYYISPEELNFWYEEDMSLAEKEYFNLEEKYKFVNMDFEYQDIYDFQTYSDLRWQVMAEYMEWEAKYDHFPFLHSSIRKF